MSSRQKPTPRKAKAAKGSERNARALPGPTLLKNVGRAAALLILAGISSPVSQLSLSPVYGSIPSSLYHKRAIMATGLLTFVSKRALKRYLPSNISNYIAIIAYWIPVIQFFFFQYSSQMGPIYGPLITELVTYLPLLFLSVYSAGGLFESVDLSRLHPTIAEIAPAMGSYVTVTTISKMFTSLLPQFIGTHLIFTRLGLQLGMGSALALVSPSRLILLAVPAIIHTMRANPHFTSERTLQLAYSTLQAQKFTLLDRHESLTGYLSVLEGQDNGFRALRCDHSLLGGEWLVTPERAAQGQSVPETIFTVFTMLEAVRLMEIGDGSTKVETKPDSQKSALVIGLGIGTAPNSLISHNINTTIVELDPAVHRFALKYFGLSKNHTAVIDDAVSYVEEKSFSSPGSFDYIIHDVFTGGAEPVMLFTVEFFEGLKKLLTDDGVVAINYAGDLSLPSTLLVLNTIHAVFPACRLFRDNPPQKRTSEASSEPDFINMVVFCAKNDLGKGRAAISFREPTEDDIRGSLAKRSYLMPQPNLQINFDFQGDRDKVLKRGEMAELEKHQNAGAISHWRIMRTVLPDKIWEMW